MSHINEALKKAQKEKEIKYISVIRALEAGGRGRVRSSKRAVYSIVFSLFLIFLVFMGYSWLDLSSKNEEVIQPKNLSAAKEMTEVSLVKKPEESQTAEKKLPASTDKPDDPLNKVSIYESAGDMFREGRTTEAEARYRKILEIDPGHVETLNDLGVIYMNKGDYNSALSTFEKTVKLKPDYVEAYYNMACLFSIKGEPEKGIVYLKKAVGLDENVREWALSDSDLRDMRELPEFQTEVLKR